MIPSDPQHPCISSWDLNIGKHRLFNQKLTKIFFLDEWIVKTIQTYQRLSRSSSYIHNAKLELAKTQSIVYKNQLHKKINATLNGV
jgi:hypothetical protein